MSKKKLISKWKALDKVDFKVIPDTTFTRDKTGVGSIEVFQKEHPEGITYPNGYHKKHPSPGNDVILYNPKDNDEQDIRLDALHIMPRDATYDALNTIYRNTAEEDGDLVWDAKRKRDKDAKNYGENLDDLRQYFNNEADALLRNLFIEGTPEYIESKGYNPNKTYLREKYEYLIPEIDAIQQYLETGERPQYVLPEVVITSKRKVSKNKQGSKLLPKHNKGNVLKPVIVDRKTEGGNPDINKLDDKDISNPNKLRNKVTTKKHALWINPLFVNSRPSLGSVINIHGLKPSNSNFKNA